MHPGWLWCMKKKRQLMCGCCGSCFSPMLCSVRVGAALQATNATRWESAGCAEIQHVSMAKDRSSSSLCKVRNRRGTDQLPCNCLPGLQAAPVQGFWVLQASWLNKLAEQQQQQRLCTDAACYTAVLHLQYTWFFPEVQHPESLT